MKRHLFLLLAVLAAVTTAAPENNNCIVGCKCQENKSLSQERYLRKIYDCDSPLTLTNQTFAKHSKEINTLCFENVIIVKIEQDALIGFNDLEQILVKDSSISSIDSSAFDLPELGTVTFSGTTFGEVLNLTSDYLESLTFNNCKLSELPNLDQLPSLITLNVENNYIRNINESAFSQLVNLEELSLSNNSISKLSPDIFNSNTELNTLNLDNNPLEVFQLSNRTNLEYLSLKSCKLTTFDANTSKNLDIVTQLDLSNNQISILPIDAFAGIDDLTYIDLSNNELVELSDDIFENNTKLEKIILDGNKFQNLPKFQCDEKRFQTYYFSCKNCGLKSVKNAFKNMPAIVTLILSENQISNVEGIFNNIQSLKELDLSNNTIKTIGVNAFSSNTALETLNLSGNPLKPLDPVVFAALIILKKLDVSNTGLAKLWANHNAVLPSLERLFIGRNNFTTITVEDLNVTPNLKLIDLEGNDLNCTQELQDIIHWLIKNSVNPIQGADKLKTHEAIFLSDAASFEDMEQETSWKNLADSSCSDKTTFDDDEDLDTIEDVYSDDDKDRIHQYKTETSSSNNLDEYYDEYDEDDYYDKDFASKTTTKDEGFDSNILFEESVMDHRNINLARASYILSVTTVFVLTALVVLTVAVAITLFILKKNGAFNMHNGNLPRLKIPLWHSTPAQKKHSGSVYKPLSEDLSGPKTPIINRYEFKSTPAVHNSIP